jgi:hypothetical protein
MKVLMEDWWISIDLKSLGEQKTGVLTGRDAGSMEILGLLLGLVLGGERGIRIAP